MDGARAVTEVTMHPNTQRNLARALEREAVAAARLTAYSERALRDGDPDAARTLRAIAHMDLQHAAEMAELLGWVGSLHENVLASVVGDATTHGLNYATLAGDARAAGDHEAADLLRRLTADETEAAIGLLALASRRSKDPFDETGDRAGSPRTPDPIQPQSVAVATLLADVA
jgi:rubrerythrin